MSQNFLADPVHNDLVLPLRVCQCREDFGKKIVQFVQFLLNVTRSLSPQLCWGD